jgi:hypothetical protein
MIWRCRQHDSDAGALTRLAETAMPRPGQAAAEQRPNALGPCGVEVRGRPPCAGNGEHRCYATGRQLNIETWWKTRDQVRLLNGNAGRGKRCSLHVIEGSRVAPSLAFTTLRQRPRAGLGQSPIARVQPSKPQQADRPSPQRATPSAPVSPDRIPMRSL